MGGEGWSDGMRQFINFYLVDWIPEMQDRIIILTTDQLIGVDLVLQI